MSFKSKSAISALCVIFFATWALADQLTVTGTVKDSAGAAVAGAIVSAGFGSATRDTTDATGAYTLVIANNTATTVMVMAQSATGGGFAMGTATVAAPGDGTADVATVNITMGAVIQPTGGDTLVITGTVKDSSGAAVANAVVTVGGGIGAGARDTTDASGAYSITYVPAYTPNSVTVTATQGTRTGRATVTVPAGSTGRIPLTANITLASAPVVVRDTLVISGTVKDSAGAAVADAIVTVGGGMGAGARDTADASGAYSITYVPAIAPTTVTVTATLGTQTGRVTVAVPTGSSGRIPLTANIILGRFINSVLHGLVQKAMLTRAHMPSYGYSIDGRRTVTSPAGARANGIRFFKVEGTQKVLMIK